MLVFGDYPFFTLEFTPLEFETKTCFKNRKKYLIRIYSVGV